MLKTWLAHPLTQGLKIDDSVTTQLRRQIIREKGFLRRVYEEWYTAINSSLPLEKRSVIEIGSGAGFLTDIIPDVINSEVFFCSNVNVVMDGCHMPFADRTINGIVMTDVFHHLPQPRDFLREATRCIRRGGVLVMIEPWVTSWSRFVYSKLHHEPFLPDAEGWSFFSDGPLSGANGALPWIIFERDRKQFEAEFPQWSIRTIKLMMPFRYIVSGGVSLRSLQPEWSYGVWRILEYALRPFMPWLAMFALIVVDKVN
jgi:SAM-dependent methyltransferase